MKCRQRWTTASDGTSLAFWDEGQGPAVVLTNGFANSTLYWEPLRHRLRKNFRVIRWDLRGHGRSGAVRDPSTISIAGCADDMRCVLDAAGVDRAAIAGFSLGCQIVLEAWRHFPERIDSLLPVLGPCERPFDTLLHPRLGPLVYDIFRTVPAAAWGGLLKFGALRGTMLRPVHEMAKQFGIVGRRVSFEEMEPFYRHLAQLDVRTWYLIGLAAQRHSARDLLADIDVPTLVIAGGGDRFSPGHLGREVAEAIDSAELLWLEEATHTGLFDERERIGAAVEEFLHQVYEDRSKSGAVA